MVQTNHLVDSDGLMNTSCTAHLPDRMHAQLGGANIQRPHAKSRWYNRTDGRATGAVVTYNHVLKRYATLWGYLPEDSSSDGCRGIFLISIVFHHYALPCGIVSAEYFELFTFSHFQMININSAIHTHCHTHPHPQRDFELANLMEHWLVVNFMFFPGRDKAKWKYITNTHLHSPIPPCVIKSGGD